MTLVTKSHDPLSKLASELVLGSVDAEVKKFRVRRPPRHQLGYSPQNPTMQYQKDSAKGVLIGPAEAQRSMLVELRM